MEYIAVGQSVKIKRTDGRVHVAVVSKMNETGKSITVEWYERGETKGKEIDLDALLALNPEIIAESEQHAAPEPKKPATQIASSVPRNITAYGASASSSSLGVPTRANRNTVNSASLLSVAAMNLAAEQAENIPPPAVSTAGIMRSRTTNNATRLSLAASSNGATNSTIAGAGGSGLSGTNATSASYGSSTSTNNASVRRSGVVKEVERLKENREKRRARHAELKEEKVALMNQDPGNPNWETAQMIREYQSTLEFNPLIDGLAYEDHQITVCVRKRPLSRKEIGRKEIDVISVPRKDTLIVHEPRNKVDLTKFLEHHKFRFDYAFDDRCDNAVVYK